MYSSRAHHSLISTAFRFEYLQVSQGGSERYGRRCKETTRSPHSDVTTNMFEEKLCNRLEQARGEKVPPECETMIMIGSFITMDFFV